jgi:acyl carrier protein
MEDIYIKLAEILEVEQVQPGDVLRQFENWDSLTALSILATLDASYGVNLTAGELREIKTAGELVTVVDGRRHK